MYESPRVLVVDDESSVRRQLTVGLAQRGFQVEPCELGLLALEKIEAARKTGVHHHCVVLDICLPDVDGLKLLNIIKKTYPDLPIIIISGFGDEQTSSRVQLLQGHAYLDKPFEMDALIRELYQISPPDERTVAPRPKPRTALRSAESAYLLVRARPEADLTACYNKLYFAEGVCYCDAVVGEWDIVMLLHAADRAALEALAKKHVAEIPEIGEYRLHFSEHPPVSENLESFIRNHERIRELEGNLYYVGDRRNRQLLSAYAFVEIDREKRAQLYAKFYFDENIVYCDMVDGASAAILLLQCRTMDALEETLRRIRDQEGVLRSKAFHIMETFDV
jgi:CheY-like chemotaxis protein